MSIAPAALPASATFTFRGFRCPTYTMVPDELFDELLVELSGAELKTLLYIIRRTFGFKRDSDSISLSQMLRGIQTADGRTLDRGVGLSKPTLLQALRSLQEKHIIETQRQRSVERGDEPTVYALKFVLDPRGQKSLPPPVRKSDHGGGQPASPRARTSRLTTQHTQHRQTESTDRQQPSPALPPARSFTSTRAGPVVVARTLRSDESALPPGGDDLVDALAGRGVTRRVAARLLATRSEAAIRAQLQYAPHRAPATSPAGALVRAIEEDWAPPQAWVDAQSQHDADERRRAEAARKQAEDDAERRRWEALSPEEKVRGRVEFWISRQRLQGHEPSAGEIAARRAELIGSLTAPPPPPDAPVPREAVAPPPALRRAVGAVPLRAALATVVAGIRGAPDGARAAPGPADVRMPEFA